jgi:hypothetical protein
MVKFGMKSDTIQFWILVVMGLTALASFASWADARYAKEKRVNSMSWELHALYLTIPDSKRAEIEKQREQYEMSQDQK